MKTKSVILLLILSSISVLHAADWPQWRGPTRDGQFTSTYGGKTIGFKVAQVDGKFTVTESWRHKAQGYMTTPLTGGETRTP